MRTNGYTFAFDDSGGIEPFLRPDKTFHDGNHPFFLICSIGIRNDLLDQFRADWQGLRHQIADELGLDYLPALHARLMFGKTRPPRYRGIANPYYGIDQSDTQRWYTLALDILNKFQHISQGMSGLLSTYKREDHKLRMITAFSSELSQRESSYIKFHTRHHKAKFHQKYISAATSSLIEPIIDCFGMIQEQMRQVGGEASVLLDGFSDSDGLDDVIVFNFINQHVQLSNILNVAKVLDSDGEPLLQASDLLAYAYFRSELRLWRQAHNLPTELEPLQEIARLRWGPPKLTSANVGHIWRRKKTDLIKRRLGAVAQYVVAYHGLLKFAPEFTTQHLVTPEEFLERVRALHGETGPYIPILKNGVLEAWEAQKGEDRA